MAPIKKKELDHLYYTKQCGVGFTGVVDIAKSFVKLQVPDACAFLESINEDYTKAVRTAIIIGNNEANFRLRGVDSSKPFCDYYVRTDDNIYHLFLNYYIDCVFANIAPKEFVTNFYENRKSVVGFLLELYADEVPPMSNSQTKEEK